MLFNQKDISSQTLEFNLYLHVWVRYVCNSIHMVMDYNKNYIKRQYGVHMIFLLYNLHLALNENKCTKMITNQINMQTTVDYFFALGLRVKYKIRAPMTAYVALAVLALPRFVWLLKYLDKPFSWDSSTEASPAILIKCYFRPYVIPQSNRTLRPLSCQMLNISVFVASH
ncbi:unnamed protein product [Chrysodeixis includens]|uniref:Uncharacterized protein n=1 Tax=Chrysodeixis includens TaxID=689277 RepID=A0A9P0FZ39_CHRIL|nr:unnamed protein product [Chrysodeixis includens]